MDLDIQEFKETLEDMKRKYSQDFGSLQKLEEDKVLKEKEINQLIESKETTEMLKVLLTDASVEARKSSKDVLQTMATSALQFIMGDYMSLEILLDEKGNAPVAEFISKAQYTDYSVETDPADEEGGGVGDIVSFSTFFAMLQLAGKNNVAPLFLDEPSKYVSKGHSENVAKFLYETSAHFGRQVFMVTHDELLAKMGDKSYHFKINEGTTITTAL